MKGTPRGWTTRLLFSSLLVVVTSFVVAPAVADRTLAANECLAGKQYVPNEVIVGFQPGQSPLELNNPARNAAVIQTFRQDGATWAGPGLRLPTGYIFKIDFRPGTDLCKVMADARALPEVKFAEPNLLSAPPGDTF